ncbi:Stk1 family PASTA domain-containing Ser/Thr kinase [Ligilactobacillus ceti]|uniref:non-specific serine/threonine protein kinase n=1 Tax=Ligilactobacillus ceti DSM 22408 TaxID=1122146 RepID=A0A0R2KGS1_9LACO|nr:Stk1 family PASTA domain-containing Ser/Thr kinase [Ligilactobacillus ceti]KRN88585.1 non-specific serine threonine protein kinase [Ligilactobacillus ceti DSM 22408]
MKEGYILNGRYRILRSLGEGGMANVYLAYDLILKREVAVKVLRLDLRDDPVAIRRFKREALSLAELDNPYVVNIYDVDEYDGMQYLVMEYINGMNLKQYLKRNHPLMLPRVVELMNQILIAVQAAHDNNIIHRDLKPQNILIDEFGDVKITDFGISVISESTMTKTNTLMGSVHYISPEQVHGQMATKQSDIYALGIILYELLTGDVPFKGENALAIAMKHFHEEIPTIRNLNPNVPQALENVVLKATAKNVSNRYLSAREMQEDLVLALEPSQADVPKWEPILYSDDATKVLPKFTNDLLTEQAAHTQLDPEQTQVLPTPSQADTSLVTDDAADEADKIVKKKHSKRRIWSAVLLVVLMVIMGIFMYNHLPIRVSVPDVSGLTQKEAIAKLKDADLEVGTTKKVFDDKIKSGKVIKTNPSVHEKVKRDAKIDLILSKGPSKQEFGDYHGEDYTDVAKELRKKGVKVSQNKVYSDSEPVGKIVDQSILADEVVNFAKTSVVFDVSQGPKQILVRDLMNYTEDAVKLYAEKLGLDLHIKRITRSQQPPGVVMAQEPYAGAPIRTGGSLYVTISEAPKEEPSETPVKAQDFTIKVLLPARSGKKNNIKIYLEDDDHSLKTVYQNFIINQDTEFDLPFTLKPGHKGKYKITRDGKVLLQDNAVSAP